MSDASREREEQVPSPGDLEALAADLDAGRPEAAVKARELARLVDYADGSIVSRTLSETDRGTVTLFAFDAGQALSEHTTPFDAFVLVLDGRAELTVGGRTLSADAGRRVVMPADVPHAVRAPVPFKMLLVMRRPNP
jgi:quercetin dioxygenase-like cupin family protein